MKHLDSKTKRRMMQRAKADILGISLVAAIFSVGVVTGLSVRSKPADTVEPLAAEDVDFTPVEKLVEKSGEAEEPAAYYPLTDEERDQVERVVMAEAEGEGYDGQRLVAQCILNAALTDGITPAEAVVEYKYTKRRPEPSESVKEAVSAVFDRHEVVTQSLVLFFYAPARTTSEWHESMEYVLTHKNHKFFTLPAGDKA